MVTMAELKRDKDTTLGVWPNYDPQLEKWVMQELAETSDQTIKWRQLYYPDTDGHIKIEWYTDKTTAIENARNRNSSLAQQLMLSSRDPILKRSLELKVLKFIQSKERLQNEEALMLNEAIKRHANDIRSDIQSLRLASESEKYRQNIFEQLSVMPYLKAVRLTRSENNLHGNCAVFKQKDGSWSKPHFIAKKGLIHLERAKIAHGFELSESAHWGKTKVHIREILLPRANQLLQQASVQRLLAQALAKGQHVLVSNGIVFWYEQDGTIGWQVKTTSSTKESDNSAIWKEGTIHSTNHGRLIVLPYIKDNGELVKGHTKNGPNDGRAKPRHPGNYVDIPFTLYDGDLMIGLFGELPYE